MTQTKQQFLTSIEEPWRGVVNKLVKLIEASHKDIGSAIKWHQLTFGLNDDYDHWICAVSANKKAVCLTFHFGSLLDDKKKLFTPQDSKFTRKIELSSEKDMPETAIKDLLKQAYNKLDYFKENWKKLAKEKQAS